MEKETQSIVIISEQHNPVLENLISKNSFLAEKTGEHYAKLNQLDVSGDRLMHYTGEFL